MKNKKLFYGIIIAGIGTLLISGYVQGQTIASNTEKRITQGEYMGQKWYIDKNHMLHWDGKPYIPHALNDFPLMDSDFNTEIKPGMDDFFSKGVTDFFIIGYEPDMGVTRKQFNANLKQATDYITSRGGTFIISYSLLPVYTLKGDRSIAFFLDPKTQQAFREDLHELGNSITAKGFRGVEFSEEINGLDRIGGASDPSNPNKAIAKEVISGLDNVLNIYGKIVKEELGDVPVFSRVADPIPGFIEVWPWLPGLCADNIDGISLQLHPMMPEDARVLAEHLLITRSLNTCPQTKLLWGYSQSLLQFLYRSKEDMHGFYQPLIDIGTTGFLYDEISSWGLAEIGLAPESDELRDQNQKWWGELKPVFKDEILRYAKNNEFSTSKWAVPLKPNELPKTPKVLTAKHVFELAKNHPDVKRVMKLGASLGLSVELVNPIFNQDYGLWTVGVGGEKDVFTVMWIEDSKEGKVLINGIKIFEDARQAGYPIPSEEQMIRLANGESIVSGVNEELIAVVVIVLLIVGVIILVIIRKRRVKTRADNY